MTTIIHHGDTVRPLRFEVEVEAHWNEVLERTIRAFNEGPVDTVILIYPSRDDDPVDFGIILEGGRQPFCFEWTYSPTFNIRMVSPEVEGQLSKGVGVETIQGLLDRDARNRQESRAPLAALAGGGNAPIAGNGGR